MRKVNRPSLDIKIMLVICGISLLAAGYTMFLFINEDRFDKVFVYGFSSVLFLIGFLLALGCNYYLSNNKMDRQYIRNMVNIIIIIFLIAAGSIGFWELVLK